MNGVEIAEEAQRRQPGIKVLLTTGYAESDVIGKRAKTGIDVLGKPYRRRELLAKINELLDESAKQVA